MFVESRELRWQSCGNRLIGRDMMRLLQHIASVPLLIALLCQVAQAAGQPDPLADVIGRRAAAAAGVRAVDRSHSTEQSLGFVHSALLTPAHAGQSLDKSNVEPGQALTRDISAKWREVLARIDSEEETLAACRANPDACTPAARRLLQIVELGRQRAGRARLGEINRAVNLSIRPASDSTQYGVDDFWSAPLATIEKGAGDCEDYAILKYLALREAGISPDDLRLLIVSYPRRRTIHAVLGVHLEEEWLLLDNLTMVMVNSLEATQYRPLIALDAMTTLAAGSPAPQGAPAAIQNNSGLAKDVPGRSVAR
jgi:predicted transglutaminase-like cysteine proteinase